MKKDLILTEVFDPGIKHALFSNFSKYTEAILELVDNSVSNRIEGNTLMVLIGVSPKLICITDLGGRGMGVKELDEFLKWGKIKTRNPYDIGAYSQGGKSAMGYLGNSMTISTSPKGSQKQYIIEDNNLHNFDKLKKYRVREMPTDFINGKTEIIIRGLKRHIKDDVLKSVLVDTYRPLINNQKIIIKYNGEKIMPQPFPLDEEFKVEQFNLGQTKGWVGRLTSKSGIKGGMRCYSKGRLICDREFFSKYDANYKGTLNYLFGEVEMDNVPANTNKTDFNRDSDEWIEAEDKIFKVLKSHIDELLGRVISEPTEEERQRVERAKNVFTELMKRKKRELLGTNLLHEENFGQKKPTQNSQIHDNDKNIAKKDNRRENQPRTPPPADAIGRRKRVKEFMNWSIRAMDEGVRSILEDEGRMLVINNLFPGYIQSKATELYLLETATLQISLPEVDEKMSPSEYLQEFDENYAYICTNLNSVKEEMNTKKLS